MLMRIPSVVKAWGYYECASLSAGVAFYAAVSLFPLMMVLVAGVGYFFRFMPDGPSAKEEILEMLSNQMSPEFAESMTRLLLQLEDRALVNGPLAGLAFLFTATLVFAQVDRGFYRIWDVRRKAAGRGFKGALRSALISRLRSLVMIMAVCMIVVCLFLIGMGMRALATFGSQELIMLPDVSKLLSAVVGAGMNVVVLTMMYKFLSKEKVSWRIAVTGGLIAAGFWELGSRALTLLSFGSNLSVYGLIGSFLVVLLWIYYTAMVLFAGALIVKVEKKQGAKRRS